MSGKISSSVSRMSKNWSLKYLQKNKGSAVFGHPPSISLIQVHLLAEGGEEQVGQVGNVVTNRAAPSFGLVRCVRTSWVKVSFCILFFFPLSIVASLGN